MTTPSKWITVYRNTGNAKGRWQYDERNHGDGNGFGRRKNDDLHRFMQVAFRRRDAGRPFKSQNMSRFSTKAINGEEMSRAQYLQAEAARTTPIIEMNPILIKPVGGMKSDVRFFGEAFNAIDGFAYREQFFTKAIDAIRTSLDRLNEKFDVLVIEGAGSPAEVNLNDREIVNMRVADMADVPVLLVADIDRGGAIASIVGTLQLMEPEHRARVKGIVINKFHGDVALFEEGIDFIETYTGIRVVGVIPHMMNHGIEEEDTDRPNRRRLLESTFTTSGRSM
ncbi:cobyric acid synthase [Sporosarcina thermotolerans]|nr:cobyric acid synthase [Sporosarcina thermotolerans]WHT48373.1 cobyric acid synthase [Sporosarcina thermotolerans]